jgi:hypothetical protein
MIKSHVISLTGGLLAIAAFTTVPAHASLQCTSNFLTKDAYNATLNCLDWGVAYVIASYDIQWIGGNYPNRPGATLNFATIYVQTSNPNPNPYQLAASVMCNDYNVYATGWSAPTTSNDFTQGVYCPSGLSTIGGQVWELIQ